MNVNSWLMFLQYAACFGVELTVNNVAASYFSDEFDLSTSKAGLVASLFGLMNLFARSMGGIWSGESAVCLHDSFWHLPRGSYPCCFASALMMNAWHKHQRYLRVAVPTSCCVHDVLDHCFGCPI